MARLTGTKNADHQQTRLLLLKSVRARLLQTGTEKVSFRELAEHAGVSVPTLRHYFGTRTALINSVYADLHQEGIRYLHAAATGDLPLEASMQQAAESILAGMRLGQMHKVHALGLTEGLDEPELGPAYLNSILEPSLQALERRLDMHRRRGEFKAVSTRYAALAFVAPLLLATLHQRGLGGDCVRPLDLADFASKHAKAFACAYGTNSKRKKQTTRSG